MDKYTEKIENNRIINLIKPYIKDKEIFIVGGFIRDLMIFDKESNDIDLIVCTNELELFAKDLADKINAYFIELDPVNSIYRLVLEDKIHYLDITKPINNSLEDDVKRRDFTMNAILYDINYKKFIDLTNGIEDIKAGIINGISQENFIDDPLRLIRIFRFHAKTGFEINKHLILIAKEMYKLINNPAKERLNTEILKIFEGKYTDSALLKMDECSMLEEIFPEFSEVKKIPPNSHHHLDLFHHSIETVKQLQNIYENSEDKIKEYLDSYKYGSIKQTAYLKLAGFLHDIGKPKCWTIEEDTGRHRFIKHDDIGSKLVVPTLKQLKFSKKQIDYIKQLIKYHIYPSSLICSEDAGEKSFMKFYRKMDGYVIDVILLAMADRLSARGEKVTDKMVNDNINGLKSLLNNYLQMQNNIKPIEKLLDGIDIMEILNIKQGKELGEIINALKEAQIAGDVNNREEAVEFVRKFSNS